MLRHPASQKKRTISNTSELSHFNVVLFIFAIICFCFLSLCPLITMGRTLQHIGEQNKYESYLYQLSLI